MVTVEVLKEVDENLVPLKEIVNKNPTNMPGEVILSICEYQIRVKKKLLPLVIKDNGNYTGVLAIACSLVPASGGTCATGTLIGNLYLALDFKTSEKEDLAFKLGSIIGNYMKEYNIAEIQCPVPKENIPHITLLLRAGFHICGYTRSIIGEFVFLSRKNG
jgi:hypothetical protein